MGYLRKGCLDGGNSVQVWWCKYFCSNLRMVRLMCLDQRVNGEEGNVLVLGIEGIGVGRLYRVFQVVVVNYLFILRQDVIGNFWKRCNIIGYVFKG